MDGWMVTDKVNNRHSHEHYSNAHAFLYSIQETLAYLSNLAFNYISSVHALFPSVLEEGFSRYSKIIYKVTSPVLEGFAAKNKKEPDVEKNALLAN